jgi:HPt (histidine-containing phosphotransfer) domain-containing protein
VNYSDATGYGQANSHKNQLFLYFTELAQRIETINLRITMDETQDHWEVGFEFGHQGIALEEVPHWDPRNFKLGEELGFRYVLLKPPQSKKALSIMLWDKALEIFTLPDLLEEAVADFIEKTKNRLVLIDKAFEASNHQEIQRNAHGIKGTARTLFIKRVAKWAWALESDAAEEAEIQGMGDLQIRLRNSFQEFLEWYENEAQE